MKNSIVIIIFSMFSLLTNATPDAMELQVGAKGRKVKMSGPHRVIPTIVKVTNGSISTGVAAVTGFALYPIEDVINDDKIKLRLEYFKRGEQGQWVFRRPIPFSNNYHKAMSWGLFQFNPLSEYDNGITHTNIMAHELGHGVAVDTMGPLILPFGAVDYLQSGAYNISDHTYSKSIIERAADMEALQNEEVTRYFKIGLYTDNGNIVEVPGLYFSIVDKKSYVDSITHLKHGRSNAVPLGQQKRFEFLKTRLQLGEKNDDCDCERSPALSGEFQLGEYRTRMLIGDNLKLFMEGAYELLDFKRDRQGDMGTDLFKGVNKIGVIIPMYKNIKMNLSAGAGIKSSIYLTDDELKTFDAYAGLRFDGQINVDQYLRAASFYEKYWGISISL